MQLPTVRHAKLLPALSLIALSAQVVYTACWENQGVSTWKHALTIAGPPWSPPAVVIGYFTVRAANHRAVPGITSLLLAALRYATNCYHFSRSNSVCFLPSLLGFWIWAVAVRLVSRASPRGEPNRARRGTKRAHRRRHDAASSEHHVRHLSAASQAADPLASRELSMTGNST